MESADVHATLLIRAKAKFFLHSSILRDDEIFWQLGMIDATPQ
jgi:hypothetical protein